MYWLTLFELLGISIFSSYLIYSYCEKDVPIYVQILAILSWVMNFTLITLIPVDIYITQRNADLQQDPQLDPAYMTLASTYQILYWIIFLMCWTVIPLISDYENAVDFDWQDRLKRSIRENIKFYIFIAVLGAIFILYIIVSNTAGEYGLLTFFKAIANSYGVLLIIVLLGYSLVSVPRAQMRTSDLGKQIKYLYFRISSHEQELKDAKHVFEEQAERIFQMKEHKFENIGMERYIQLSLEIIPADIARNIMEKNLQRKSITFQKLATVANIPNDIEEMKEIYRELKKANGQLVRIKNARTEQLSKAFELEDIMRSLDSGRKVIEYEFKPKRPQFLGDKLEEFDWYWQSQYKPQAKVLLSVILGCMSTLVLIQEVTLFTNTNFTIFGIPLKLVTNIYWMQIFTFIPLFYIAFCVYYGLFRIKITGQNINQPKRFYGLYPDHSTDAPSLLFTTVNFSRVSAPLCFNFLSMVKTSSTPAFNYAMGNVELIPIFGISFTAVFPLLLVVLCLIYYYDFHDRVMNFFGIKQFLFSDNFSDRLINEGRQIVKEERIELRKTMQNVSTRRVDGTGGLKEPLLDIEMNNNGA